MSFKLKSLFKSPKALYLLFLTAVSIWCFMIIAAPLLAKLEYRFASGIIYMFFSKICHQIADRSFFIFGKQFAVCSRCTGLYFGFLLGTIIYPVINRFRSNWIPAKKYFYLALLPIFIDFFFSFFHIAENTLISRLITGLILGATTVFFILPGFLSLGDNSENKVTIQD